MGEGLIRSGLFMAAATVPPHRAQIDFGAPVDDAYLRTCANSCAAALNEPPLDNPHPPINPAPSHVIPAPPHVIPAKAGIHHSS